MPEQPVIPEHTAEVPPDTVGSTEADLQDGRAIPDGGPGLAIITSKIERPVLSNTLLRRPRLVGWFDQQKRARVLLISAEAGYGKSTLLADYSRSTDATCIWYRLETSDGDWITFLSHLVAAVRCVAPGFGQPTEALLRHIAAMGPSRELVVATFLSDLDGVGIVGLTLILDDYHLVEDSGDVRLIMARLLERAPASMRFVLAGRGRPSLSLARLAGQGRVAEMTTSDLRFTRSEIEDLFDSKYQQPLAAETCDIVERRTEGWAASLQLISASIATSRPSEVGSFMEALSGAEGPIYDFLAEEVLSRLPQMTQRVLVHASLIDRVKAVLVSAALSATDEPIETAEVEAALDEVEKLGLLSHNRDAEAGTRFHPLLRQFLEHQMSLSSTPDDIKAMHLAVARVADGHDWLVAGDHYAMSGHADEAMRVLGEAASQALGTGAWGAAAEIVESMPDTTPPPAVEVIKARALTSGGRPDLAIAALDGLATSTLDLSEQSLLSLARASALQMAGRSDELWQEVHTLGSMDHVDPVVRHLAHTWVLIKTACHGGSIGDARRALDQLISKSSTSKLGHFAGIALHNSATAALSQGDYESAVRLAAGARSALAELPPDVSIGPSTLATQAVAKAELGQFEDAQRLVEEAISAPDAHPDVLADASYLAAIQGDIGRARILESRLGRLLADGLVQVGATHQAGVARVTSLIVEGRRPEAKAQAEKLSASSLDELDSISRGAYLKALCSALLDSDKAADEAAVAVRSSQQQQSWRWELRARTIEAAVAQEGEELGRWLVECGELSGLAILELADLIGASLHLVDPIPNVLVHSIARHPARWRPILRRQLGEPTNPSASIAARLLTEHGTREDASQLAAFERQAGGFGKKRRWSRDLVRRVSPTLRVHDLGRTTYEVPGGEQRSSATRRKALSMLLFLVTKPKQTATREQVMEELWPNQSPTSAMNSLHQTLHFVRRDIAPWEEDGATADYVPLDSELIYLDPELVQVDSVSFMRQATESLLSADISRTGPGIVRLYTGRFAPEFEYEDWAEDWRTALHAKFLHLTQATAAALLSRERMSLAIDVLSRAVEIDGHAFGLRETLIRSLANADAMDAAVSHYQMYSTLMDRDLGLQAQTYEQLVQNERRNDQQLE